MGVWVFGGKLSTDSWNNISLYTPICDNKLGKKIIFTLYIRSRVESSEIRLKIT